MNSKKRVVLFYGLIFLLKIGIGIVVYYQGVVESDAKDYLEFAEIILRDGPFTQAYGEIEAFAPPGFPWVLALVKFLTGWNGTIVVINALLSTITVWIIYKLSTVVLPAKWARSTSLWAVVYVPYSFYLGNLLKESLLYFLVSFSVYLLYRFRSRSKILILISLGFIFVYTFHTDERYIVFLPLFFLGLIEFKKLKKSALHLCIFVVLILVFSAPWFIRNYRVYNRPILITERFQSPIDKKLGIENRLNNRSSQFKEQLVSFRDSLDRGFNPIPSFGRERALMAAKEEGLHPHDFSLRERIYFNSLGYWSPVRNHGILIKNGWKYKGARSFATNILYSLNYGLLLPFMVFGVFMAFRRKERLLIWLVSYLFLHYCLHVLMIFGSGRYRHPVDFIVIILAFYGIFQFLSFFKERYDLKFISRLLRIQPLDI